MGTFFGFSSSSFPVSLWRGALGSVGIRIGECPPDPTAQVSPLLAPYSQHSNLTVLILGRRLRRTMSRCLFREALQLCGGAQKPSFVDAWGFSSFNLKVSSFNLKVSTWKFQLESFKFQVSTAWGFSSCFSIFVPAAFPVVEGGEHLYFLTADTTLAGVHGVKFLVSSVWVCVFSPQAICISGTQYEVASLCPGGWAGVFAGPTESCLHGEVAAWGSPFCLGMGLLEIAALWTAFWFVRCLQGPRRALFACFFKTSQAWDFPGGPVAEILSYQSRDLRFDPWLGN